ncbi:MAG: VCBS repeat-containing protein [Saprospiraceae bacterium]|nr:VCBS repeat-containing protein [Saprospiraceae bacterium]
MKTFFSSVRVSLTSFALLKTNLLLLLALFSLSLAANTLRVPQDFTSIQAAVNAAQEGDTVLVSPGIYYENVQLRGRNIVLTSRFELDKNPDLIEETIVDGSQPAQPDTASCLLIWKGESAATVVQGFTFRGGRGTIWLDPAGFGTFREGGGILTEFSSPVIRHNIIRNNVLAAPGAGMVSNGGGGIRCGDGAPRIENNRIMYNQGGGYGGGIVLNYCPGAVVRNNIIARNSAGKDYSGGGFWCTGQNAATVVVLENNVIAYNTALPGSQQFSGKGGGIWTFTITLQMQNNIVWGNSQAAGAQVDHANGKIEAQYNCIEGGLAGAGNLSANPVFADTLCFLLSPGSPCVDAGHPDVVAQDASANGNLAAYPSRGARRNDMGAYGGPARGLLFCSDFLNTPRIFSKVTNSPVSTTPGDSRSVNWIDIDGDKDLDLFISNGPEAGENNFLYRNNGVGVFTAISGDPIVQDNKPSDGATWADVDNDGDNDCFVVNWYGVDNLFYLNKGAGTFQPVSTGYPVGDAGFSETASWGDYDKDGRLDLYVTNSGGTKRNYLYHNDGNNAFTKISSGTPVTDAFESRCVNWVDFDNDGDQDLFVTNESDQDETLYRNTNGAFSKVNSSPLVSNAGKTMSASWGDYDNDGDQDVFLANDKGNDALFRNDDGVFVKILSGSPVSSGGNSFGSQWADVNNDGFLDLFVTNSFWGGPWQNFLFLNDGKGGFQRNLSEVPATDKGWSYGCAFGDMDRDGDLDLAVANCYQASQPDYLYENHSAEGLNHWLQVELVGTKSNRSAIGAKVRVRATIGGVSVLQMREISAQTGYCGQNQLAAHFGLGDAAIVESIEVQWPSGTEELYVDVYANQFVTLTEDGGILPATETPAPIAGFRMAAPQPNPFLDSVDIPFELDRPMRLRVELVNSMGQTVNTLADQAFGPGAQRLHWDGKTATEQAVPPGLYWVVFRSERGVALGKCLKVGGSK